MATEEDIKPELTTENGRVILRENYGFRGGFLKQLQGYDDLNFQIVPEFSCNPFVKNLWRHGYVFKVMNSLDSQNEEICQAQNDLMLYLRENEIPSPVPVQTIRGEYYTTIEIKSNATVKTHIVRVLEYQPGTILKQIPKSFPLFYNLGIFLGKLNEVLKNFHHPAYESHTSIWHLSSAPKVRAHKEVVIEQKRRELVEKVLNNFEEKVLKKSDHFEKGMIHGDYNEHNILLGKNEKNEWDVTAILDFGDSHVSFYLFELAIGLCYMMLECKSQSLDPIQGSGHLIAGYLKIRPNFSVDLTALKLCICARLCQSLVLGLKAFQLHPDNNYVLDSQQMGWTLLEELWEVSDEYLTKTWNAVIQSYNIK